RPRRALRRELRLGPGRLRPARADAPGRARGPREDAVTFPRDARPVPVPGRGPAAGPAPVPPLTAPVPIAALPPRRQPTPPVDARPGVSDDPDWYRTAVFYEVIVRAFSDSDGSGTGDLRGLIDRLDYLQWLGIDALWLPPFYPSPLRDGGYAVPDYPALAPHEGPPTDSADPATG